MAKIDELSAEIKKYTKSYNDILVGMHNDIIKYKKSVTLQSSKTTKALNLIDKNLVEIHQLENDVKENILQIKKLHKEVLDASEVVKKELIEFEKEKQQIANDLIFLKEQNSNIINLFEEEKQSVANKFTFIEKQLTDTINSNHLKHQKEVNVLNKKLRATKNTSIIMGVLMIISICYLYFRIL